MLALLLTLSESLFHFDDSSFKKYIEDGTKSPPWFIMFGSPQCPACLQAYPEFEAVSEKGRGFSRFAYIDTKQSTNTALKLHIFSVPSFYLFTPDGEFEFSGLRSANSFVSFISERIGEGLDEADENWASSNESQVVLFTRRFKPPAIFSAAYGTFKDKGIRFGMVRDSETLEEFGNPPMGTIWFFKNGEKVQYKGKNEFTQLINAIADHYEINLDEFEENEL